jgi:hypothetical protein
MKRTTFTPLISLILFLVLATGFMNSSYAQVTPSKAEREKLLEIYNTLKNPEISFENFLAINAHVIKNARQSKSFRNLLPVDLCSKVRTFCANSDFENGLDQNEYTGAYGFWYGNLNVDPFSTYIDIGFNSGSLYSSDSHQTIVNKSGGTDPITGISVVPSGGGNQSLRLGNAINGYGTEILAKTIVVDPAQTILGFYYALVFEDPNHQFQEQPAFSVRVYDCATGLQLPSTVCDLGNGSNIAVSDARNPFFKSLNFNSIAYRDWSRAQINLSAYVGKTVTIMFTNKDCGLGGHWGYTYLDNLFGTGCPDPDPVDGPTTQGFIKLGTVSTCGKGNICLKYGLPFKTTSSVTTLGDMTLSLDIYQNNALVKTIKSPKITTNSSDGSYCFSIDPATLGLNTSLGGFDYAATAAFNLSGFPLSPAFVGNPPGGITAGVNNDYLLVCASSSGDYYSKAAGDLHNTASWGVNPDGSGAAPPDFGTGKTFHLVNRVPNYILTANFTVGGKLDIPSGSQLQIGSNTLSVADLIGTGSISGTQASNLVVTTPSAGNTSLNFTAAAKSLNSLTIQSTSVTTVSNALSIYGVLNIAGGTLNTGNNITLKSTAAGTARVAPVTGTVTGTVTAERYIPARRAWRILSAPVGGSQTISAAWQEGATTSSVNPDPNPGYGTHITEGTANGFDHNPLVSMPSIKKYMSATNSWVPLTSTNATGVNAEAYMTFVRGHRATPLGYNTVPATNTTLRSTGALKTGNQTFAISATGFTAVPNPFASPINYATITRTNVPNNFYLWDPKLGGTNGVGGYVLVSFNGTSYDITPAPVSAESQYIQSGQGFLVQSTGVAGSLVIKESDKSATAATNVFRTANTTKGIRFSLQVMEADKTPATADEAFTSYSSAYSNRVDAMDPVKLPNINENLGIEREQQSLMIERRGAFAGNDTISLRLWNTVERNYLLQVSPENLASSGIASGYLEDKYLKITTPISLSEVTRINFSVDGHAGSSAKDRFRVILSGKAVQAGEIAFVKSAIKLASNPINGNAFGLQFINQPNNSYTVTLFNTAGQKVYQNKIMHAGGTATQTLRFSNKMTKGLYRLSVTGGQKKSVCSIPVIIN